MSGHELDIIEVPSQAPANLFGAASGVEVVERATEHAKALADVIRQAHLYKTINDRNHVLVEGWCLLGSMLGVFPVVVWTRQLENGWEARVEARTLQGQIVGAAEAECLRSEKMWASRDDYALRGMAQTRATSRALRGPLGFIVSLAGYNPTGAEEIPADAQRPAAKPPREKTTAELHKELGAVCGDLDKRKPRPDGSKWEDRSREIASEFFQVTSRAQLDAKQLRGLIDMTKADAEPF